MTIPTNDFWINRTRPMIQDRYLSIRIGKSVPDTVIGKIQSRMNILDQEIGVNFRYTEIKSDADVLIQYRSDLPIGANGWAAFGGNKWKLEVAKGTLADFVPDYAAKIVMHEMGHALGLDHHWQRGVMYGNMSGVTKRFSFDELNTLRSIWTV